MKRLEESYNRLEESYSEENKRARLKTETKGETKMRRKK